MKVHHLIKSPRLHYPMSSYIMINMPTIHYMMNVLYYFLKKQYKRTDVVLFCRGSSGAILAGLIANYLIKMNYNVRINHIKKEGESSHGGDCVERVSKNKIKIIVDDFIATGDTVRKIIDAIKPSNPNIKIDVLCVSDMVIFSRISDLPIKNLICE